MTEPSPGSGPAPPPDLVADVEGLLRRRSVSWRAVAGGYTTARRFVVGLEGGESAFVKAASDDATAGFLREEAVLYRALEADFLPRRLAYKDGPRPVLVLEDLSRDRWPPPWGAGDAERVLATLRRVGATSPPDGLPSLEALGPLLRGWTRVAADPRPFLSLGLASERWLRSALPALRAAEDRVALDGPALLHGDVRSDNLCFAGGRVVLVDWNWACRGDPRLDVAFWAPSLHAEGGPAPESVLPDGRDESALVAGYFASQAGLSAPTPSMVRVREVQLAQLRTALPWAARANRLPAPDEAR